jgi:hypothetical protein
MPAEFYYQIDEFYEICDIYQDIIDIILIHP